MGNIAAQLQVDLEHGRHLEILQMRLAISLNQFISIAQIICCVIAVIALCSHDWGRHADSVLSAADTVIARSKDLDEEALLLKCRHAMQADRYNTDMYHIAKQGYEKYRTLEWLYLYGKSCEFRYQEGRVREALDVAERLFASYVRRAPYDPRGYVEWGWCLSHLGRPSEAETMFIKALELKPDYYVARDKLKIVRSDMHRRRLP